MVICNNFCFDKEALTISTEECIILVISHHNQVAISTSIGVQILTLDASAKTEEISRRELLTLSKHVPLEKWLRHPDNYVLWSSGLEDMTTMCLLPEGQSITSRILPPTFAVALDFSPPLQNACYLAILTSHGAGEVYLRTGGAWVVVCDFMEIWHNSCTKTWEPATDYSEWKRQLYQGKPKGLRWVQDGNNIYLVVLLLNGDVVIFQKLREDGFSLTLMGCIEAQIEDPIAVHAFVLMGQLVIFVTNFFGQIFAIHNDSWKLSKKQVIWSEKDHLAPNDIFAIGDQLIVNKIQFVLLVTMDPNGAVSYEETSLANSTIKVFPGDGCVYALLSDRSMVKLGVPGLKTLSTHEVANSVCSQAALSSNGQVLVSCSVVCKNSTISVYFNSEIDVLNQVTEILTQGKATVTDCLDLLWVIKVKVLKHTKGELDTAGALRNCLQLRYWLVLLLLTSDAIADPKLPTTALLSQLQQLEIELLKRHVEHNPHLEAPLNAILGNGNQSVCAMCQGDIKKNTVKVIECEKGHKIARCCLSLRPCLTPYYYTCQLCPAVCLADEAVKSREPCYFCGGIFTPNLSLV